VAYWGRREVGSGDFAREKSEGREYIASQRKRDCLEDAKQLLPWFVESRKVSPVNGDDSPFDHIFLWCSQGRQNSHLKLNYFSTSTALRRSNRGSSYCWLASKQCVNDMPCLTIRQIRLGIIQCLLWAVSVLIVRGRQGKHSSCTMEELPYQEFLRRAEK